MTGIIAETFRAPLQDGRNENPVFPGINRLSVGGARFLVSQHLFNGLEKKCATHFASSIISRLLQHFVLSHIQQQNRIIAILYIASN
jgi:hypothetical protein